jgi:molecular chaperone GrpE
MEDLDLDTILTPTSDEVGGAGGEETVSRAELTGEVVYPEAATPGPNERLVDMVRGGPVETSHSLALELEQARRQLQRNASDFENYKRRFRRESQETVRYANESILRDMLPVLDNLERAAGSANGNGDDHTIRDGLRMVVQQMHALLDKYGVRRVVAQGQTFNPAWHEAMRRVESTQRAPGMIVEVLQPGYTLEDRLLRPSRVVVSVLPEERTPPPPSGADLDELGADMDIVDDNGEDTDPTLDIPIVT